MGNVAGHHGWLHEDVDWTSPAGYISEEWRSALSRELDKYGGLCRSAVRRGNSMTAKLGLLGTALAEQGLAIEKELYKKPERAYERTRAQETLKDADRRMERLRQQKSGQRSPGHSLPGGPNPALDVVLWPEAQPGSVQLQTAVVSVVKCRATGQKCTVATWRLRIHAARRRTMLIVMTAIRFRRCVTAPQRCSRVAGWSWAVADKLEDRLPRFADDQMACVSLRASIDANKALLESLCPTGADSADPLSDVVDSRAASTKPFSRHTSMNGSAGGSRSAVTASPDLHMALRASRRIVVVSPDAANQRQQSAPGHSGAEKLNSAFHQVRAHQGALTEEFSRGSLCSRQASSGNLLPDSPLVHRAKRLLLPSSSLRANASDPGSSGGVEENTELQSAAHPSAVSSSFANGQLSRTFTAQGSQRSASLTGAVNLPSTRSTGRSLLSRGALDGQLTGADHRALLQPLAHVSLRRSVDSQNPDAILSGPPSPPPGTARSLRNSQSAANTGPTNKTRVGFGSTITAKPEQTQIKVSAVEASHVSHTSHMKLMKHLSSSYRQSQDGSQPPQPSQQLQPQPPQQLQPQPPQQPQPQPPSLEKRVSVTSKAPSATSLMPHPPSQPPPEVPHVSFPTLLPRTVAAAASLKSSLSKDQEATDQFNVSNSSPDSQDERSRWQHKLSRLRRGEPVQPLTILLQQPSEAPSTPDNDAPPITSVSPPAEAEDPDAFVKYNYFNNEDEDVGDSTADVSQSAEVPSVMTYGTADQALDTRVSGSAMYDTRPVPSEPLGWKQQLKEELESMNLPPYHGMTDEDREEAELASLSATWNAAEARALEAIEAAARNARKGATAVAQSDDSLRKPIQSSPDRAEKILVISQQLEADIKALRAAEARLTMHINRTNCTWAEAQTFQPPDLWAEADVDKWIASPEADEYKATMVQSLKSGQVAVHFNAFEDYIELPSGDLQNLWCAEPWALLDTCRPGLATGKAAGLTWGGRAIAQLVSGVESAVGPADAAAAVANLWLVLALDDEMQHAVVKDMWAHRFYGLQRERVLFTMQTRRPAHLWNSSTRMFEEDELSDTFAPGSGVSLMQLSWACEAFTLDQQGAPQPLHGTVLELLQEKQVDWLLSRRARDLGLISRNGALSLPGLVYGAFLREAAQAGMITSVHLTNDLQLSRAMDSLVLGCKSIHSQWRAKVGAATLATLPLASAQSSIELSHMELQSAGTSREVVRLKAAMGGQLAVSCSRYMYHLPTLKSAIACHNLFRPKLQLVPGARAHVSLNASDLTALPIMRCLGMVVKGSDWHGAMLGRGQMEKMLNVLQAQDDSPDFRKLLNSLPGRGGLRLPPAGAPAPSPAPDRQQIRTIVVFVVNNRVSQTAVDIACSIAKPGRDALRLVTFVSSDSSRDDSQDLLIRLFRTCTKPGLAISTEVVVRGENGLLDCMESYLASLNAHMAVMGSDHMTLAAGNFVIGSVALSIIRRVRLPVLLVTANSAKFAEGLRPKLRLGLVVESACRPLHSFLCEGVADSSRGDSLVLMHPVGGQASLGSQPVVQRRIIDSLHVATRMHSMSVLRTMGVEGPMDKAVMEAADTAQVNVLGLQVGGHTIPQWMQNVLRSSRGAVLVYRNRPDPHRGL